MKRGPVHLHIDELVLHGFNPADRHHIADAVQRELMRLLEETEISENSVTERTLVRVDAGAFTFNEPKATTVGLGVARAVSTSVSELLRAPAQAIGTGRVR